MTLKDLKDSVVQNATPPQGLTPPLLALWHAKAGQWEQAHNIAQDLHTPMGSWIHALLHLIEGDLGNAGYWFQRAGRPRRRAEEIEEEWERIASFCLAER